MGNKVAFCVVTWNNADVIATCLDSLLAQQGVDYDIYLIDNASTDNTRAALSQYPNMHVTYSDSNRGFAGGNNILIKQALADPDVRYVALINSDAVLAPDWTATLVAFAENHGHVGSLQGLTLDFFDNSIIDSQHIYVNQYLVGVQYGYSELVMPDQYYPRKVFGVNAAAAIYTRAMIEALPDRQHGFLDERFHMYYEDVDAAFRALVCGWDAWFVPKAVAYHMGSVSAKRRGSSFSARMTARNWAAMVFKNAPWPIILKTAWPASRAMVSFARSMAEIHGQKVGLQTALALVQGVLRLPIYASSRRRILAKQVIDSKYLLHILNNNGILG